MTLADYPDIANHLCDVCHHFGERGWCRATSGNFSARIDAGHCLITQSGRQKSSLTIDDLMICDLAGTPLDSNCRPSAETPLHCSLYRLDASIGAVLHTHSVYSTLLSKTSDGDVTLNGYEMQKALAGVKSHSDMLQVRVFDNDQDMDALARRVSDAWAGDAFPVPGFLVAGHGLYAWGADIATAVRHIEGFEFLFACLWQEKLAGHS